MDVQQLRVLDAIVEEGSFTAAARRLHLTQSGVSRAISNLEAELGINVLERSRKHVWPTQFGERVLAHARTAVSSLEAIEQEASAFSGLETGIVKVGAFPSVCSALLPQLVAGFEAVYPGIRVELSEGWSSEVLGWVEERGVDVGFVGLPLRESGSRRVESYPFATDSMVAVVSCEHRLAGDSGIGELVPLADEPFILPRGHHEEIILQTLSKAGITPRIRFKVRDANSILAAVGHGLGWSVVNEMSVPKNVSEIYYAPVVPAVGHEIGLAVRSTLPPSPAVNAFVEYVMSSQTKEA